MRRDAYPRLINDYIRKKNGASSQGHLGHDKRDVTGLVTMISTRDL